MLELLVDRKYKRPSYTIGKLYVDGKYFCDTIEDTDRGLRQTDPLERIKAVKVASRTAIPTGTYQVTLGVKSPKYSTRKQYAFCKGYLPRLLNVPGYDGVLIHIGNTAEDTAGCLLVGENKEVGKVLNSTATFKRLYALLDAANKRGETIRITYK